MKVIIPLIVLTISQAQAMINCPVDTKDEYPFVVKVNDLNPEKKGVHCTGSVIQEKFVIIAAHCLVNFQKKDGTVLGPVSISERDINVGVDGKSAGPKIKKIFVNPNYKKVSSENADLAIIELETSYESSGQLSYDPILKDTKVSMVGTGLQKGSDYNYNDGKRRTGSANIAKIDNQGIWLKEINIPNEYNPDSPTYPKCIPAFGDSGSPLIVDGKIRGIYWGGPVTQNENGEGETKQPVYTDISTGPNKKFIESVLALNNEDCPPEVNLSTPIHEKENELLKLKKNLNLK